MGKMKEWFMDLRRAHEDAMQGEDVRMFIAAKIDMPLPQTKKKKTRKK